MTSSCGVCGKAALEFVKREAPPSAPGMDVEPEVVLGLPDAARAAQVGFERTGSLHATGIFEPDGRLLILREDVGRHNAMDKAVGALLLAGRHPLEGTIACLSGRAAFELVQKASVAGMAGVVSVGAPTTLAVRRLRSVICCSAGSSATAGSTCTRVPVGSRADRIRVYGASFSGDKVGVRACPTAWTGGSVARPTEAVQKGSRRLLPPLPPSDGGGGRRGLAIGALPLPQLPAPRGCGPSAVGAF